MIEILFILLVSLFMGWIISVEERLLRLKNKINRGKHKEIT